MFSVKTNTVYEPKEVKDFVLKVGVLKKTTDNKKITYYNAPMLLT